MFTNYPPPADPESGESDYQRLERRWNEQLSELRVTQTGTQIMTGFLLTLPFQPVFSTISGVEKTLYLVIFVAAIIATITALAPVSFHRILFGHPGAKQRIVGVTHMLLQITLVLVSLVLAGTTGLVLNLVVSVNAAIVGFVGVFLLTFVVWVLLPVLIHNRLKSQD